MFKLRIIYFMFITAAAISGSIKIERVSENIRGQSRKNISVDDFHNEFDLYKTLKSLKRIINFAVNRPNDIDVNYEFGLFLLNVYLKLLLNNSNNYIQYNLRPHIMEIIHKNSKIIEHFNELVKTENNTKNAEIKLVASLFSNESIWMASMQKYEKVSKFKESVKTLKSFKKFNKINWDEYYESVYNIGVLVPNPSLSDKCLSLLALNPVNHHRLSKCKLEELCRKMLKEGTNFGYSLTHRTLFILMALYGRGCYIFTPQTDRELVRTFCAIMYNEAEYIAENNYGLIDLIVEQITICGLGGEKKFLKPLWLSKILKYQTPLGCYGLQPWNRKKPLQLEMTQEKWKISKVNHSLFGGVCDAHMTSVATAALGIATRAYIEN